MNNIYSNVKSKSAVRPVALAEGSATSIVIDTLGYRNAMFVIDNGAVTGAPDSYAVSAKVQECDTADGSFEDIADAEISDITANNKSAQIEVVGLDTEQRQRYIKLVISATFVGGTTPAALVAGTCLLGDPERLPVGNSTTAA